MARPGPALGEVQEISPSKISFTHGQISKKPRSGYCAITHFSLLSATKNGGYSPYTVYEISSCDQVEVQPQLLVWLQGWRKGLPSLT